jgi:hypothetical protein
MERNGATLPQRVIMLLRAKLHLALFAVVLHLLDFAAPLLASWLLSGHSAPALLDENPRSGGSRRRRRLLAAASSCLTIALTAFFRAGIRSSWVLPPRADGAQFRA